MRLQEDTQLYKGVFWIKDLDDIYANRDLCFQIPCDMSGLVDDISKLELNAKSGNTYNHEKLWNELPSKLTDDKPFNYYPRGRVEIKNGIVDIFLNPNINIPEIIDFLKSEFNLSEYNGIKKIRIHNDCSEHYKCYLDRD